MNLRSGTNFGVMRNQVGGVNRSKIKEILIYQVFKHRSCVFKLWLITYGETVWEAAKLKVIKLARGEIMTVWSEVVALGMEKII